MVTEITEKVQIIIDNIMTRTSVRSYLEKQVEEFKVEQILRAAMAAPSAKNLQPWSFVVVRDKQLMNALAEALPYAKMLPKADVAIVVCGDLSKSLPIEGYWAHDASAVSQNILLAAHALGLGAVWTGVYPRQERVVPVQEILNLPQDIVPLNVIPLGYPAKDYVPRDKWDESKIHYEKW